MKIKLSRFLLEMLFINVIIGFPFISSIPDFIGEQSRLVTVPYRAIILLLSLLTLSVFYIYRKRIISYQFIFIYFLIWSMMFVRLYWDLEIKQISTIIEPSYYFTFGFGAIFIPSLVFLFRIEEDSLIRIYKWSLYGMFFSAVANLFAGLVHIQNITSASVDISRISSNVFSPITYGYLGVTLIILAISNFPKPGKLFDISFRILSMLLGIVIVSVSGSRGPLVALIVCLLLFILTQVNTRRRFVFFFLAIILVITMYIIMINIQEVSSFRPLSRIDSLTNLSADISFENRIKRYKLAINQFLLSPILGNSLVIAETKDYPHNIIIEAFMSLGVVGAFLLIAIILKSIKSAFFVLKTKTSIWVSLIYIQFLIGAMVSGSLFTNTDFWFWSIIIISVNSSLKLSKGQKTSTHSISHGIIS